MPKLSRMIAFAVALAGASTALSLPAAAKPPLEAFGDVPEIRSVELSPDGRIGGDDHGLVDADSRKSALQHMGEFVNAKIGKSN